MSLLALVATILVGVSTPVTCSIPSWLPTTVWGYAFWPEGRGGPAQIYLRYCRKTVAGVRPYVDVFAHELLHVEHPWWSHPRVYAAQHRYGAIVLKEIRSNR